MTARWAERDEATLALNAAKNTTTDTLPVEGSQLRPAGPPVTVEQVCDVDTYVVQVRLDPDQIIVALAKALRGRNEKLMLVRHLPPDHPEHIRALADLTTTLADTFTVELTPDQAEDLGGQLYDATTQPDQCVHCEAFSTVVVDGNPLCPGHARALDQADLWDREPS